MAAAFSAHSDDLRERLQEPLWRDRSAATDPPATPDGTCWLSLGLGALLPASGEDERANALCRDELLFTVTDTYMPGPEYTVYDIAPPGVPLSSEGGVVNREVLLMANAVIGGMMPEPGAAERGRETARIRQRLHDAGPRQVELPLSPEQLGISTPALLVPDPFPPRVLRFTNAAPFDATHPLEGVTIVGAGAVLDRLRRASRGVAIDQACRLLVLTMIEGVIVAVHDEAKGLGSRE